MTNFRNNKPEARLICHTCGEKVLEYEAAIVGPDRKKVCPVCLSDNLRDDPSDIVEHETRLTLSEWSHFRVWCEQNGENETDAKALKKFILQLG